MTGTELTDRLIDDLGKAIRAKSIARSPQQQQVHGNNSLEEFVIGLNCYISLPGQLSHFVEIINSFGGVIESPTEINLSDLLASLNQNRVKVADKIQLLKNGSNFVYTDGTTTEPFYNLLKEKLDFIHHEAMVADKNYVAELEKKRAVI